MACACIEEEATNVVVSECLRFSSMP